MLEPRKHSILDIIRYRFNLDEDKEDEETIIRTISRNVEFRGINLWTLIFAIFIASIGLNVNSPAVIIGAMLISPLMGPIMGIGLGAGIFDFKLIKKAIKNLAIAVLISLATSALYFYITPLHEASSELLARTTPTIWDVLIALFGGLSGIIASSRKHLSNVIPGVAIATALMPPLCTAGYGLGTGNLVFFAGAFYLFLINSVFISIATFLMVKFLKFRRSIAVDEETGSRIRKYVWIIAMLTILPSIYLAYRFVKEEIFQQNVKAFISQEVRPRHLFIMDKMVLPAQQKIVLTLYGDDPHDSIRDHLMAVKSRYGLAHAEVILEYTTDHSKDKIQDDASSVEQQLIESDKKIHALNGEVQQLKKERFTVDASLYAEFSALYGIPDAFSAHKALVQTPQKLDTVLFIYYSLPKKSRINQKQLEAWLRSRYPGINGIKVVGS